MAYAERMSWYLFWFNAWEKKMKTKNPVGTDMGNRNKSNLPFYL